MLLESQHYSEASEVCSTEAGNASIKSHVREYCTILNLHLRICEGFAS